MSADLQELNNILKSVAVRYMCIITIVFSFFSIFYWIEGVKIYSIIAGISVLIHAFLACIPYRLGYESIKPLIPVYLVFISVAVYPFIILHWQVGNPSAFAWLFILPSGTMLFLSFKANIYWYIYIFILVCSVFFVSPILPKSYVVNFTELQTSIVTFFTFITCFFLIFFFLYYSNKVNQMRMRIKETDEIESEEISNLEEGKVEYLEDKYNEIYSDILNYFDKEKPYCDPDFTISQLASAVDSNVNYISRAIKKNKDMNFNVFVNTYRVNMIKEMLCKDYYNKYTIRHIYTSSGFKHQSTFNKAFKQIEGITPSDYIKDRVN